MPHLTDEEKKAIGRKVIKVMTYLQCAVDLLPELGPRDYRFQVKRLTKDLIKELSKNDEMIFLKDPLALQQFFDLTQTADAIIEACLAIDPIHYTQLNNDMARIFAKYGYTPTGETL